MKFEIIATEKDNKKPIWQVILNNGFSYSNVKSLKKEMGQILQNDIPVRAIAIAKTNDKIIIDIPEKKNKVIKPIDVPLEILFEDDYLLIVNKPPFVSTIPHKDKMHLSGMVLNYLGGQMAFMPINRLDTQTSGIVIIAKNAAVQHKLLGKIKKTYLAVCDKVIKKDFIQINKPIAVNPKKPCFRIIDENGKESITRVYVKERFKNASLLHIELLTGRTHQIRVHLNSISHSIIGDDVYGKESELINRLALHAIKVEFKHPILGNEIVVDAPIPDDIKKLIASLE